MWRIIGNYFIAKADFKKSVSVFTYAVDCLQWLRNIMIVIEKFAP